MSRSTGVYKRRGSYFFVPLARTVAGVWIHSSPIEILGVDATPAEIGETLRRALNQSVVGVPHPTDWSSVPKALYDAAAVKKWSSFVHGTLYCSVTDDRAITLVPTRNDGGRGGFAHLPEMQLVVDSTTSAEQVGNAVMEAMRRCR